jgi:hypothetical protein
MQCWICLWAHPIFGTARCISSSSIEILGAIVHLFAQQILQTAEFIVHSAEQCQEEQLNAVLVVYRSMLPRSPDEEEQNWLIGLIDRVKGELARRTLSNGRKRGFRKLFR